jgi:uncharacterized membrane protein YcaP (DUF421 family)
MFGLSPYADAVVRGLVLGSIALGVIIVLVRCVGLRSFSKMTAFDFVITIATGSLLATAATATGWSGFLQTVVAIAALMGVQVVLALVRRNSDAAGRAMENAPLLLMRDGVFLDAALASSRVTRADVFAKLREANALDLSTVRAVVLETTGDISVLHGSTVEATLLDGVRSPEDRPQP